MRTIHKIFLPFCSLFAALSLLSLIPAATAQTASLQPYSNASDGFRANFPSEPEITRTNVPVGEETYELRSYMAQAGPTVLYVGVCDYGPKGAAADPDTVLKSAKDGAVQHMSAHILTEKKITLEASQAVSHGVEFIAESDKFHFTTRMYLAGGVLYQTMVISPLGETFADSARFLDSFAILPRPQVALPAIPPAEWKPYSYPADGFSASLPSAPKPDKQSIPTDGGAVALQTYEVDDASGTLIAAVCNYGAGAKDKDPDALLESAKSGAVTNISGHLTSERKITLGLNHGVAFEADSESAHISARIYLVGTTLYQMIVAAPSATPYANSARFLESFQLIDHPGK